MLLISGPFFFFFFFCSIVDDNFVENLKKEMFNFELCEKDSLKVDPFYSVL